MSFDVAMARMAQLQSLMNPVAAAPVATATPTTAPTHELRHAAPERGHAGHDRA